jgi:hypothetical protein
MDANFFVSMVQKCVLASRFDLAKVSGSFLADPSPQRDCRNEFSGRNIWSMVPHA